MTKIKYLGHSFFKFSFPEANVLVDPFIKSSSSEPEYKRLIECPVKEKELNDINVILVTHEHFDHFDKEAIECIAKSNNAVVVGHDSLHNELSLERRHLCPIDVGKKIDLRKINVEAVTAHHPNSFNPLGYIIQSNNTRIYHAGDTDLIEEFANVKADIALLPIGGAITMDCVDAVRATKYLKPKIVIPMHYNTFASIKAEPLEFKQRIEKSVLEAKPIIMQVGEEIEV